MLGQIPKANRLLSDWVLRDLHGPLIGRPGHCFAPSSINAASKSRNSNYSKLASFLAPVSAQADVMAAGGGQAVRAINCARIDRVTRIPASMIEYFVDLGATLGGLQATCCTTLIIPEPYQNCILRSWPHFGRSRTYEIPAVWSLPTYGGVRSLTHVCNDLMVWLAILAARSYPSTLSIVYYSAKPSCMVYTFNTSALKVALQLGEPQPNQSCSALSRVLPLEPNRLFWNMTDLNF